MRSRLTDSGCAIGWYSITHRGAVTTAHRPEIFRDALCRRGQRPESKHSRMRPRLGVVRACARIESIVPEGITAATPPGTEPRRGAALGPAARCGHRLWAALPAAVGPAQAALGLSQESRVEQHRRAGGVTTAVGDQVQDGLADILRLHPGDVQQVRASEGFHDIVFRRFL